MSSDTKFMDGLIVKNKRDNAPDFVIFHLSFKVDEICATLQANARDGWVNGDILISKAGKPYCKIDDWQPTQGQAATQGMQQAQAAAQPAGNANYQPAQPGDFDEPPF